MVEATYRGGRQRPSQMEKRRAVSSNLAYRSVRVAHNIGFVHNQALEVRFFVKVGGVRPPPRRGNQHVAFQNVVLWVFVAGVHDLRLAREPPQRKLIFPVEHGRRRCDDNARKEALLVGCEQRGQRADGLGRLPESHAVGEQASFAVQSVLDEPLGPSLLVWVERGHCFFYLIDPDRDFLFLGGKKNI